MTAGPKVRCQKCEKFFHSTCLGISKRLHRTDRPSICSNCLKCKSCSSTNVSKFVGNLPHCISCFKLRQKGNFCPVCQKCYENDNLELKMMECGACKRWIHAKCESLTDEQYNMLSVLPENIEFICRRCSKEHPTEAVLWRDAVTSEFNACLLSVIKLLSKSREACALLKLSPRKKNYVPCVACQQSVQSNRAIEFATGEEEDEATFDQKKFNRDTESNNNRCTCSEQEVPDTGSISLLDVKQKIAKQQYHSLHEFHYDMNLILQSVDSSELGVIYKEILSEIFPWFQNETKACTDALEESMYDSNSYDMNASDEESLERQVPNLFDVRNDICIEDFWSKHDARCCVLCRGKGEEDNSRFLFCGQNMWIHVNCALYSAEVFEEIDGSLQNVHSAINRGRLIKCSVCGNKGATVGCNVKNCGEHYHYPCARQADCLFLNNQTTLCPLHKGEASGSELLDMESLSPNRPIYVELDRKKKKMADPHKIRFYLGSLSIERLGRIVPSLSDSPDAIVPTDFQCVRLYWSTQEPWKIVKYSIKTSILTANGCGFDNGKNYTVDHTRDQATVQANLCEISKWHMSLNQEEEQQLNNVEETNDEEPQNNADLLPPEIKDAIFEDLPHDMLNSISMLDIFSPKLMTEEYPLTVTDVEQLKDSIYNDSNDSFRFEEFGTNGSSSSLDFIEESLLRSGRDSKRTKSELLRANYVNSINSKKRKLTHKLQEIMMPMKKKDDESLFGRLKISQMDGSFDLNPKRRKRKVIGKLRKKHLTLDFKISQLDGIDDQVMTQMMPSMENPVSCERCRCTYRTQESYERHLAGCDVVSTSDSEPESPRGQMLLDQQQQQIQNEQVQTFALNINTTNGGNSTAFTQGNAFPLTIDPQTNAITVGANYAAAINRTSQQSLVQNAMPVNLQPSMANMANVILAPSHQLNQQIPTVQMNGFQQQLLPFQALSQLGANVITSSPFMQTQTTTTTQQVRPEYEASKTQQIVQQAIVQNNLATQGNKILIPANRKHALPRLGEF